MTNSEGAGSSMNPGPSPNPTIVKNLDPQHGGARERTNYNEGIRTVSAGYVTGPARKDLVSLEGLVAVSRASYKKSRVVGSATSFPDETRKKLIFGSANSASSKM